MLTQILSQSQRYRLNLYNELQTNCNASNVSQSLVRASILGGKQHFCHCPACPTCCTLPLVMKSASSTSCARSATCQPTIMGAFADTQARARERARAHVPCVSTSGLREQSREICPEDTKAQASSSGSWKQARRDRSISKMTHLASACGPRAPLEYSAAARNVSATARRRSCVAGQGLGAISMLAVARQLLKPVAFC